MREKIAAISSDNHLQPYTWAKHPELHSDSYYSFEQLVDYCVADKLPLILAGDIIDTKRPDPKTVGFMLDQIERMKKESLNVYFIQGQHELNRERPWMTIYDWATHIHKKTISIHGVNFYGLDYTPADQLQDELNSIPKDTDVLVCHQVWKEHLQFANAVTDSSFSNVPKVSYIATGDYHAHKTGHYKGKSKQQITVMSPGSTYMLALDEDNRKYFFVMYNDRSVKSEPIRTRNIYRAKLATSEALDAFIQTVTSTPQDTTLPQYMQRPIWHVEYYDHIPNVCKRVEQIAKGRAHLFLRPVRLDQVAKNDVPLDGEDDTKAIAIKSSLEDYLPQCVDKDTAQYKTALRLLRATDVKEELDKIVAETVKPVKGGA